MKHSTNFATGLSIGILLAACSQEVQELAPEPEPHSQELEAGEAPSPPAKFKIPGLDAPGTADMARYLEVHKTLSDPTAADWGEALKAVQTIGDGFSLTYLADLDRQSFSEAQGKQLDQAVQSLKASQADSTRSVLETTLLSLERSAYADLTCNPMERTLPSWALEQAEGQSSQPELLEALKAMESGEFTRRLPESGFRASFERRLQKYAKQVLAQ